MRLALLLALVALGLAPAAAARDVSPFAGLGTWVDVYDPSVAAAPERSVAAMRAFGVRTLFLETSNFRKPDDVVDPAATGALLEAAHRAGLSVVAWYLPSLANPARDLRRSLAALAFRSPAGERFDGFALDVESDAVRSPAVRSDRVARLAAAVRAATTLPLGAIVPSPRGLEKARGYWPDFPYRALAASVDVFLPMTYFTYRSGRLDGARAVARLNTDLLRAQTGDAALPVHVVGGLARDATPAEVRDFAAGAATAGVVGASLYDFTRTGAAAWAELRPLSSLGVALPAEPVERERLESAR